MIKDKLLKIISLIFSLLFIFLLFTPIINTVYAEPNSENELLIEKNEEIEDNYQTLINTVENIKSENETISTSITKLQGELNKIEETQESAREIISNIEQQILLLNQEIEYNKIIVSECEALMEEKEKELDAAIDNENKRYETLCKRVRMLEESKNVTFWQILFDSESINDFLNRMNYIAEALKYDSDAIDKLKEAKENVVTLKSELYRTESEHLVALANVESQKLMLDEINKKLTEEMSLLSSLYSDISIQYENVIVSSVVESDSDGLTNEQMAYYLNLATNEINHANITNEEKAERIGILKAGLTLVGRVTYFWGGRSYMPGWNSNWGTMQPMAHTGSSHFVYGEKYTYGMDCGGFVFWCALTMYNLPSWESPVKWMAPCGVIGIYNSNNAKKIPFETKLPGDIVVYESLSHIGYYLCTENGIPLYLHCTYPDGVTISNCSFKKAAKIL